MRVFHDTRDGAFRSPFGAVGVGEPVELAVDVCDSPGCTATLRTWVDGVGESLYEMELVSAAGIGDADDASADAPMRFAVTLVPEAAGIVWYQFLITDVEDRIWRYGAKNGRMGGEGQLVGWEPPSFRLSVYDPDAEAPAWYEPIGGMLYDERACHELPELIASLCENYPVKLAATAAPWDVLVARPTAPSELPSMGAAYAETASGACSWFAAGPDVFGFWRLTRSGATTCALFNASTSERRDVYVPLVGEAASELVAGYDVQVVSAAEIGSVPEGVPESDSYAYVSLYPVGVAILHFHDRKRLAKPMEAGLGVLAHITSLPARGVRHGTLGAPARRFVDWLARAHAKYWQVLPVSPADEFGSPYAGISAFAGNTLLLEGGVDAAAALVASDPGEYQEFCAREADWLEPYCCFMAIRRLIGPGKTWQEWPKKYRRFSPAVVEKDAKLRAFAEECRREQFAFERQWQDLRAYANERGVQVIGDIPMYVSADSADAWAHPELFQLDERGLPGFVAGCAPDAFAPEGQVWGNPLYDWDAMKADGYAWWLARLRRVFSLYDFVRLDHFIGFSRYFSIPDGAKAQAGSYRLGPGYELFERAHEAFGALPVIAEDLGLITPRVRALVADCGFPGMDIIQFADGDPLAGYAPRPEKVVYTGTHDNQTLLGFVRGRYPGADEDETFARLVEAVITCQADVRVLPLQDIIGLGDEARMNVPGVAEGNWAWRAKASDIKQAEGRLKALVMGR